MLLSLDPPLMSDISTVHQSHAFSGLGMPSRCAVLVTTSSPTAHLSFKLIDPKCCCDPTRRGNSCAVLICTYTPLARNPYGKGRRLPSPEGATGETAVLLHVGRSKSSSQAHALRMMCTSVTATSLMSALRDPIGTGIQGRDVK